MASPARPDSAQNPAIQLIWVSASHGKTEDNYLIERTDRKSRIRTKSIAMPLGGQLGPVNVWRSGYGARSGGPDGRRYPRRAREGSWPCGPSWLVHGATQQPGEPRSGKRRIVAGMQTCRGTPRCIGQAPA